MDELIDLIKASIKIGVDENWNKEKTYVYNSGFITYRFNNTIYVIKESTAVTNFLDYHGFTKNENAFGKMINSEDYNRYLEKEGPDGPNTKKLSAYLFDKDFRDEWEHLTTREELLPKLQEMLNHNTCFRQQDEDNFYKPELESQNIKSR